MEEAGSSPQLWDSGKANLRDSKLGEMGEGSKERCWSMLLGPKVSEEVK